MKSTLITGLAAVALMAAGCAEESSTTDAGTTTVTATVVPVNAQCKKAFRRYDALVRKYENTTELGPNEEPYQQATLKQCSRAEWMTQAELYGDTVVLAEPQDVLDAFCSVPRSDLPACRS